MFWQLFIAFGAGLLLGLSPLIIMCVVVAWKQKNDDD